MPGACDSVGGGPGYNRVVTVSRIGSRHPAASRKWRKSMWQRGKAEELIVEPVRYLCLQQDAG